MIPQIVSIKYKYFSHYKDNLNISNIKLNKLNFS